MSDGLAEALGDQERAVASMRAEVEVLARELDEQEEHLSRTLAEVAAVEAQVEAEKRKSGELLRRLGRAG